MEATCSKLEGELKQTSDALKSLEGEKSAVDEVLETTKDQLSKELDAEAALVLALDEAKASITKLESDLVAKETELSKKSDALTSTERSLQEANAKHETEMGQMHTAVTEIEGLHAHLKTELELEKETEINLQAELDALKLKMSQNESFYQQMQGLEDEIAKSFRNLENILFEQLPENALTGIYANRMYRERFRETQNPNSSKEDEINDWKRAEEAVQVIRDRITGSSKLRMESVMELLSDIANMLEDVSVNEIPVETTQLVAEVSRLTATLLRQDSDRLARITLPPDGNVDKATPQKLVIAPNESEETPTATASS